jgi:hypothetical protein
MQGPVHKDNPHTLLELMEAIINLIRNVLAIELPRVLQTG